MGSNLTQVVKDQSAFIAVGAAHLGGFGCY
jgi:hypothetical protein